MFTGPLPMKMFRFVPLSVAGSPELNEKSPWIVTKSPIVSEPPEIATSKTSAFVAKRMWIERLPIVTVWSIAWPVLFTRTSRSPPAETGPAEMLALPLR